MALGNLKDVDRFWETLGAESAEGSNKSQSPVVHRTDRRVRRLAGASRSTSETDLLFRGKSCSDGFEERSGRAQARDDSLASELRGVIIRTSIPMPAVKGGLHHPPICFKSILDAPRVSSACLI
jgi:hypothetical protein